MPEKEERSLSARQIREAARLQETDEFGLFVEAFEAWFGKEPSRDVIEPYYEKFLADETAPFWVRSYAKKVEQDPCCSEPRPVISIFMLICLLLPILALVLLISVMR